MRKELTDPIKFKEIYRYAFQFSKADKEQKSLGIFNFLAYLSIYISLSHWRTTADLETADGILGLLLGGYESGEVSIKPHPHIAAFRAFLKDVRIQ